MMQDRTASVLHAAISEFIRTGEPISSGSLYRDYVFGIRPAMIRNELHHLTESGYLEQPYHSAGRVPTDRGYEFFAARALLTDAEAPRFMKRCEPLFQRSAWSELLSVLSNELGVLGVVEDLSEGDVHKEGLDDLVDHLDWESRAEVHGVIQDFEAIDERLEMVRAVLSDDTLGVFVGKRSPVTKSDNLSVIATEYTPEDKAVLMLIIGPKRMDYQKVIAIFKRFHTLV